MNDRPEQQQRLIGRGAETAVLTRAVEEACAGRPGLLLVEGPAGIGKTALVEHVLRTAGDSCQVLRATGVSWETDLALGVAEQLLRAEGGGPGSVHETGRGLHARWSALQERAPLVVVVDAAHWADAESLRAVYSAVRRMTHERVLALLVARDTSDVLHAPGAPGPVGGAPGPVGGASGPEGAASGRPPRAPGPSDDGSPDHREPSAARLRTLEFLEGLRDDALRLAPFSPADVRDLAQATVGIALTPPAARRLCRHTGGNPRHAGQLLHELPRETWQDWRPELPAPARYAAAVRQRLDRCGAATRSLVETCSVVADETPLAHVAALAGLDDPLPSVDEACAAGLLTAAVGPGRLLLSFAHPLVRAAVLQAIGLTRRAALHEHAAAVARDPGDALAHRVAATTTADGALAAELDRHAAERASAGEWATAADLLVQASRLSTAVAEREDRLLRAVDAMIGAGDVPEAVGFADELESFRPSVLREVVLGYLAIMRGRPAEADAFLTRAFEECDPRLHPDLMARISQRRVLHALARWDGPELVRWARKALELADPTDPSAIESEAVLGLGLAGAGRPQDAVRAYEAAVSRLPGGAQPQRFQLGRGWVDLALDAPESARRRLEAAVPTGYNMGSTRISLWAQGWLARTQFALGVWDEALETVTSAAARLADVQIELARPLVHWTGAQIHALRGDWDLSDQHVNEAAAAPHQYEVMLLPACLARAQVFEARAEYERVLDALSPVCQLPSRESVDEPGFWPWPDVYANALVVTGRLDEADAFLAPHEERAAARGHRSALARLGVARGRLTGARGDIDGARDRFEEALVHLERLPLPYDRARVNFAYGQTLRRAGKRREADTVLHHARDLYVTLGARTYVDRCDRELQAGGVHAPRSGPSLAQLTPQEQAVARLVASGATNKQAAVELYISVKTVQYHLTNVYGKLGLRSRSELAARFREPGTPQ
ncbi:AAA family ATPase [Streptomyces sp. B-S-A8]|uniref:AAA family ATPase n=1 Tax=Streptomyces solicavernae TaxID=3043614 RepID=A0ABT6S1Q8_9ACTN|nr:LuxR family transcriptional regulator [Streptomyces sp. B-S-A8]MDI3390618.1 AAA family ATPase [Streptomyces sp. B-S-A8]